MAAPEHDVDALRATLKSLGYLDAGVDRFVLAPARSGRTLWGIASRSSVRIGVLAGLLLGLSGAIAAGITVPGLVTGVRDTLVLGAMLAVVLGAAVGVTALAVILVAARAIRWLGPRAGLASRVRPLALAAGTLVGAICLAYLTFWWRAMDTNPDERSWWATIVALAVAACISLLLGHATATTTQAVITNELPEAAHTRHPGTSLRASLAIALAAVAVSALALAVVPGRSPDGAPPPRLTVVPTGRQLLVFAIDGFDPQVVDTLRRGRLAERAWDYEVRRTLPRQSDDPAREWVTIATGQPVERHGVTALEVRRVAGIEGQLPATGAPGAWTSVVAGATDLLRLTRPALNTGAVRQEKTFWEVASDAGLRTVAVNWWTSWPARDGDGTVVTERGVLRLQRGGALDGEIAPESLYGTLTASWPQLSSRAAQVSGAILGETSPGQAAWPAPVEDALRESALLDAQGLVLLDALADAPVDLATVYLPGLDILGNRLRRLSVEQSTGAMLVSTGDALVRYYAWLGFQLDEVATRRGRPLDVVIVGHPGRSGGSDAVLAFGGSLRSSASPATYAGSLLDVAPTVLAGLGVPLSAELRGTALPLPASGVNGAGAGAPGGAQPATGPPPVVSTYGRRVVDRSIGRGPAVLDEEMRDRLRSLGYVR